MSHMLDLVMSLRQIRHIPKVVQNKNFQGVLPLSRPYYLSHRSFSASCYRPRGALPSYVFPYHRPTLIRTLSSESNQQKNEKLNEESIENSGDGDEKFDLQTLTPGEKVVVGSRLVFMAGLGVLGLGCLYYIIKELMPTKLSPNKVFDRAFDIVRNDERIRKRYGEPLKGYGRDHGGHREGRRNFIEHKEYKDEQDGSNRTRVRFNIAGRWGQAFVFAEVSSDMPSGEFVYVLVQDKRNGHVTTIIDNRSSLLAQRMAGSKEGNEALQNLLGGSRS